MGMKLRSMTPFSVAAPVRGIGPRPLRRNQCRRGSNTSALPARLPPSKCAGSYLPKQINYLPKQIN